MSPGAAVTARGMADTGRGADMGERICSVDGCGTPVGAKGARGWCPKHYKRWKSHGDPSVKLIMHGDPLPDRFWAKVERGKACWRWTAQVAKDGYGVFSPNDGRSPQRAHRMAWTLTNGPIPDGLQVLHRCDNRVCVNPAHLFLGTHQDNMDDMKAKGRGGAPRKLTDEQVGEIRRSHAAGEKSIRRLASEYGVVYNAIWRVVRGETHAR